MNFDPLKTSIAILAHNNEDTIRRCLKSTDLLGTVGQIILIDTGSTDRTIHNAQSAPLQNVLEVHSFEWSDSFSDARNFALSRATNPLTFFLDSDEEIIDYSPVRSNTPPPSGQPHALAPIILDTRSLEEYPPIPRIVRTGYTNYRGRVHEYPFALVGTERRRVTPTPFSGIQILHTGYSDATQTKHDKTRRNLRLIALERNEQPADPRLIFFELRDSFRLATGGFCAQIIRELSSAAESPPEDPHSLREYRMFSMDIVSELLAHHWESSSFPLIIDSLDECGLEVDALYYRSILSALSGKPAEQRQILQELHKTMEGPLASREVARSFMDPHYRHIHAVTGLLTAVTEGTLAANRYLSSRSAWTDAFFDGSVFRKSPLRSLN